ncbi:MAG: hypothetical protein WC314_20450 [Vulcanimicrobiota bacterium]
MEHFIVGRVKELVRLSLDSSEYRASVVVTLIKGGLYERALELSLPLIGTTHSAWFLYARAWHYVSLGDFHQALRALHDAYAVLDPERLFEVDRPTGFTFNSDGNPRITSPFNTPLTYGDGVDMVWPESEERLSYRNAICYGDWLQLLTDINRNIREYKAIFESMARRVEQVLHHDIETVRSAVASFELDTEVHYKGNFFLWLSLLSDESLHMVAETLWRVAANWNYPLDLCEITSYFFYLLEENKTALQLAESGLRTDPTSVVCGNVRALALNDLEQPYRADEQWRETLAYNPDRSATFLVLGHQALCAGGLNPALRYFQEAMVVGDNPLEAERFLTAALESVDEDEF